MPVLSKGQLYHFPTIGQWENKRENNIKKNCKRWILEKITGVFKKYTTPKSK